MFYDFATPRFVSENNFKTLNFHMTIYVRHPHTKFGVDPTDPAQLTARIIV